MQPLLRARKAARDRLGLAARRHDEAAVRGLERLRGRVTQADRLLSTLSHKAILARGFALVTDVSGEVVRRAADIAPGAALGIEFADGKTNAIATSGADAARPRPKPADKPKETGGQGSLF
jgi:exodeoxyribonuclease VII large subunit